MAKPHLSVALKNWIKYYLLWRLCGYLKKLTNFSSA
jgi:hypothetical protein